METDDPNKPTPEVLAQWRAWAEQQASGGVSHVFAWCTVAGDPQAWAAFEAELHDRRLRGRSCSPLQPPSEN
jgi:hypothetical protein